MSAAKPPARRPPLIAMPFVLTIQVVAAVGWIVTLGLWGLCCMALDATAASERK